MKELTKDLTNNINLSEAYGIIKDADKELSPEARKALGLIGAAVGLGYLINNAIKEAATNGYELHINIKNLLNLDLTKNQPISVTE